MGRPIAALLVLVGALLPGMAAAQQNGSIAGVVTDSHRQPAARRDRRGEQPTR